MVFYILLILFFICIFTMLLCFLACISMLGLTQTIRKFITKFVASPYDRQFVPDHASRPSNTECYICLERIQNQVMATCNHSFCASCICTYINSKPGRAIECPACRQPVCVLFRKFNPAGAEAKALRDQISEYNFKYSQEPSFFRSILQIGNIIGEAPRLLSPQGIRFLLTNPRVKIILAMIIYTLSPLDILPEAILGPIGLIDDSVVVMNIVRQFSGLLINFISQEDHRERPRPRQHI